MMCAATLIRPNIKMYERLQHKVNKFQVFFSTPKTSTTSLENNKTKAEVMLCELLVHHNLPFTAADTFTKAVKRMFPDSQNAKELHCGRKKATGLVKELVHMRQTDIVTRMKNHFPYCCPNI